MRRLVASFYYELNGGLFTFYETKVEEISHFVFVHYVLLDAYVIKQLLPECETTSSWVSRLNRREPYSLPGAYIWLKLK